MAQTILKDMIFCPLRMQGIPSLRVCIARSQGAQPAPSADPIGAHIARCGQVHNPTLVRLMLALTKPGQLIVDLGAHLGEFTLTAASAGRQVLAVEASPHNQQLLQASIDANGFHDRVTLIRAAAGNQTGELHFLEAGPYGHVLGSDQPTGMVVPSVRMSDLLHKHTLAVDLIKMDVEGFETEVLEGMADYLSRSLKPPVLYEANQLCQQQRGRSVHDLWSQFQHLGYRHRYLVCPPNRLILMQETDAQPVVVGDCLAVSEPLPRLAGWRINNRFSPDDFIDLFEEQVQAAQGDQVYTLASLGQAFQEYPSGLVQHPRVQFHLAQLAHHANLDVRSAFAPWAKTVTLSQRATERLRRLSFTLMRKLRNLSRAPGKVLQRRQAV